MDVGWVKSGYLMKHDSRNKTTLFCFEADLWLEENLTNLPTPVWHHMSSEPLAIFPLLLSGHHRQLDDQVWSLVGQVGSFEKVRVISMIFLKSRNGALIDIRSMQLKILNQNTLM